jgi:hypothetical protein
MADPLDGNKDVIRRLLAELGLVPGSTALHAESSR